VKNFKIAIIAILIIAFSIPHAQDAQKEKCQALSCFIQSAKIQYQHVYKKTNLRKDLYHCIDLIKEAANKFGHLPELYHMLGTFYAEIHAIDTVIAYFDSVEIFCADETIDKDARKNCYKKENYEKKMKDLRQKFWEENYNEAVEYIAQFDTASARRDRAEGDSIQIYDSLSGMAFDLARKSFETAILVKPNEAGTYSSLGALFQRGGKYQEEVDVYLRAMELDKEKNEKDAEMVGRIANAYISIPDWENTIKWFKHLLEIDPENQDAMINLAAAYSRSGDYDNWYLYTEKVLEYQPENTQFLFNAGQYWYQKRMMAQSSLSEIADTMPVADEKKKEFETELNQAHDKAIGYYVKVVDLSPQNVPTLRQLGILYLLNKQDIEAAETFEQLVAIDSTDNDILDYLGRTYINMQKFLEAIRPYELLVQNDPRNVDAWERLKELYQYTNNDEKAAEAEAKAEELKKL
jgi:tetratricopeptide (TPR) repeat protein